jgi:carboxypeptidase D
MTWNGSRGFSKKTKKEEWKIDDQLAGYYTQERNLTYVLIKDGSHMVPYDRPLECLDMINRFMQVGNDVVKGQKSQVGNGVVSIPPPQPPKHENNDTGKESVPAADGEEKENQEQEEGGVLIDDKWSKYYSWGTTTLIFVILFAITICCCWCRGSKRPSASASAEFGGAPQRQREGVGKSNGLFVFIKHLFKSSKPDERRRKFRLDDNDESNEL